jgi:hypothetical protein
VQPWISVGHRSLRLLPSRSDGTGEVCTI